MMFIKLFYLKTVKQTAMYTQNYKTFFIKLTNIEVQISSVHFFVFKYKFISKQSECTDKSKYCLSLTVTVFHHSGNFRIPARKNNSSFEGSKFGVNFQKK